MAMGKWGMEMASGIRDTSKSGEVVEFVNDFQIVRICHALGTTRVEPRTDTIKP